MGATGGAAVNRAVLVYLAAIVAANLLVVALGPAVTILDAFLLIGLDLTLRDRLHDRWAGQHLALRMGLLIAAGGLISWLVNGAAGPVALASTVAFAISASADGLAYAVLHRQPQLVRTNGSNLVGAAADSVIFPSLAFGAWLPLIVAGQFAAKALGGLAWSLVLRR